MKRSAAAAVILALALPSLAAAQARVTLTTDVLRDKIKGGWAGQTIGVTFGGPTEFRYNGTMIPDYTPIAWRDGLLAEAFERSPGLYDDVYVDLTFVKVIEAHGIDAPATRFADAFAKAGYQLWHANQMAPHNLLRGLAPPASGHWLNNPDADDIDFQIEADFIGLMSPGLPGAAAELADRVGHIMNSGDGWYGGVFVATMYSQAFVRDDIKAIVTESIKAIPAGTRFRQTIDGVIALHAQYPDDWKRAWFEIQKQWAEDVGCAEGVFAAFNIDARLNAAYVVLGLLYGNGDMTKTIAIATRAGQDSDCNPSSAAGILGTMLGYSKIPAYWTQGLAAIEAKPFPYAGLSLNDAYALSLKHALAQIRRDGGAVHDDRVEIATQPIASVHVEQNFEGHFPVAEQILRRRVTDETTFTFDGSRLRRAGQRPRRAGGRRRAHGRGIRRRRAGGNRRAPHQPRAAPLRAVLALQPRARAAHRPREDAPAATGGVALPRARHRLRAGAEAPAGLTTGSRARRRYGAVRLPAAPAIARGGPSATISPPSSPCRGRCR